MKIAKLAMVAVVAGLTCVEALAGTSKIKVQIKSGKGSVLGAGTYRNGTTVTLKAKPSSGYKFKEWSGCCRYFEPSVAKSSTLRFKAAGSETIYAYFSKIPKYTIKASVKSGKGKVTGSGKYLKGKTATLKAKPSSGYKFVRWEWCCGALDPAKAKSKTLKVKVSSSEQYYAYFAKIPKYKITARIGSGKGKVTGTGTYQKGKTATLKAKPSSGYKFVRWEWCCGVLSSSQAKSSTLKIKVTDPEEFTAYFKKK